MARWLDFTFPVGARSLERDYETELAESHYPGAPGDEHEDLGDKATTISLDAELISTRDEKGRVIQTAEEFFDDLEAARSQRKPGTLFLDNGASHYVRLRRVTRRDTSPAVIEVTLEFVETLDDALRLVVVSPKAEEKLAALDVDLAAAAAQADPNNLKTLLANARAQFAQVKALYTAATAFITEARSKINDVTNRIVSIRNLGSSFGRELERLTADISALAFESLTLFNDFATNPVGTFAIGRSLMNAFTTLTAINFQLGVTPMSGGAVARGLIENKVDTATLNEGDTLQTIARKIYGSAALWTVIADANAITDPMAVPVGTELVIPEVPEEQIHGTCKARPRIIKARFDA